MLKLPQVVLSDGTGLAATQRPFTWPFRSVQTGVLGSRSATLKRGSVGSLLSSMVSLVVAAGASAATTAGAAASCLLQAARAPDTASARVRCLRFFMVTSG